MGEKRGFLSVFRDELAIQDCSATIEKKSYCNDQGENYLHDSNSLVKATQQEELPVGRSKLGSPTRAGTT